MGMNENEESIIGQRKIRGQKSEDRGYRGEHISIYDTHSTYEVPIRQYLSEIDRTVLLQNNYRLHNVYKEMEREKVADSIAFVFRFFSPM